MEKQKKYLHDKIKNIFDRSLPRVLNDLDMAGYSLKKVPSRINKDLIDFKKLAEIK